MNENENTTYQSQMGHDGAVLIVKFIALNAYINKAGKISHKLMIHLKSFRKIKTNHPK